MTKYTITIETTTPHPSGHLNTEQIYKQEFTGDRDDVARIIRSVNQSKESPMQPSVKWLEARPYTTNTRENKPCFVCGIMFDGPCGYVCTVPACPTGLGGSQC